jgi:hypothetical protein
MDAARAADASDPDRNYHFRRRWDAPPLKSKRPPMGDTIERAENKTISSPNIAVTSEQFKQIDEVTK